MTPHTLQRRALISKAFPKWLQMILHHTMKQFPLPNANGFSSIVFNGDRYPMPRCCQNQQSTYTCGTKFLLHSPNSASEGSICSQGEHLTAWWVNNLELGRRNTTIVAWLEGVHTSECGSGHMVRLASPACMSCPVCMGARAHGSSSPCALQGVYTLRLHSYRHAHQCGHWRGRSRHKQWHWQMKPFCHPYCSSYWIGSPQVVSVLAVAFSLSSWWIVFELMNDARTRKIRAGSDLRHDVLYKYIYIDKFHSKAVYVGLARAHPSHIQVRYDKPLEVCVSLNCTVHDNHTSWSSCGRC